jgi:hypothetical protein
MSLISEDTLRRFFSLGNSQKFGTVAIIEQGRVEMVPLNEQPNTHIGARICGTTEKGQT